MVNSDGQVRIIIDTNAQAASKALDTVEKSFNKTAKTVKDTTTVYNAYEQGINSNIEALREMALAGGQNSKEFQRLAQQTKEYQKALDDANGAVNKALSNNQQQTGQINKLAGAVKGLVGAYLGIQGIRMVINYSNQAVAAFRTQERAVLQLNQTLQNAGVYSYEYSQSIQQLASEIQGYSNFGDEAIIKAQALGQAYIGNTKITKDLTKAVVDFAAATGMDLESAFTLVGKSIGSQTNALGRYGISLQKGMSDSQKMEAITRQLGQRYEGTAAKMADTSVQLKNALGDLSEQFGKALDPAVKRTQNVLIESAKALTGWIRRVQIMKREIKDLNITELNDRLKEVTEYKAQLASGTFDKSGVIADVNTKGVYGDLARKYAKEQQDIIAQIKKLQKEEKELAELSNKKSFKINDDFGIASSSTSTYASVQKSKDQYEKLQEAAAKAKREIELAAIAHGTSSVEVQNAFTKYQQLNGQLQEISKLFDVEKQKTEEKKDSYQLLSERVSDLTQKLRDLAAENQIGSADWNTYKTELQSAQAELDNVNKSLEDNGIKIENVSKSISSSISSGLVNALRNGGNAFDAFSSLATTALQKILDKLIEMSFVTPVLNALTGGTGGTLLSLFGFKDGAAFQNGNVIPFAKGGVVNKPTIFPMANGGTGLMGEAGAEAVMPLRRMSNGRLGVEAENDNGKAVNVNIYNQSGANVETRKRDDGSMDIFIRKVNEALSSERTSSGFRSAYAREDRKGVQAV